MFMKLCVLSGDFFGKQSSRLKGIGEMSLIKPFNWSLKVVSRLPFFFYKESFSLVEKEVS